MIMYDANNDVRQILTNGQTLPEPGPQVGALVVRAIGGRMGRRRLSGQHRRVSR